MSSSPDFNALTRIATLGALALAALSLGACATAPGGPVASAPPATLRAPAEEPRSNYGLFLAGEAALQAGRSAEAADFFAKAAQAGGDHALIHEKAFMAAVMAGDIDKAAVLAPLVGDGSPTIQSLVRLVQAVQALADGRGKEAVAQLDQVTGDFAYGGAVVLIKPWAAAAAGDMKRAIALPAAGQNQRLTRFSALLGQAMLLERAHRYDEAEADYKALTANAQLGPLYVPPYGAYLERRGRAKEAVVLYKSALQQTPDDTVLKAALGRASKHGSPVPPMLSLKEGAALALTSAAEGALVGKQVGDADIYLRLALRLDPKIDEAWLLLGDIRSSGGDYDSARTDYANVTDKSPIWLESRERIIGSYQSAGDGETALKLARDLALATPKDREVQLVLANALRDGDRLPEAVQVLSGLIASDPGGGDWGLYFERGTALDRSGHWAEGERDLQKALSLEPDQPDVLNYLGYSWVERGEHLPQAMAMLQRAYAAEPNSGEIADSLGWAFFHLGDFTQAVQRLERAVSLDPVNAEINDHLGDAYWKTGRRIEAQFQWNRVLTLSPSAELRASVQQKLASGLDSHPASVARGEAPASPQ
jgi:Flp pilus assembly protein TadD